MYVCTCVYTRDRNDAPKDSASVLQKQAMWNIRDCVLYMRAYACVCVYTRNRNDAPKDSASVLQTNE